MKNAEQPINPTLLRQVGDNEFRIASEKDSREGTYLSSRLGLTKREYFALHLMQSLVSNADRHSQQGDCQTWNYEHLSEIAIKASDELLKQLEK